MSVCLVQGTAQLIVNVVDLDDSIPIFQDPSYLGSVLEGQPIGTIVTVVSSKVSKSRVIREGFKVQTL